MQTLYFIRARDLVKIGITENVQRRFAQLQTGNPHELEVCATIQNVTQSIERIYHRTLKQFHVRGEWFSHVALRDLITHVKGGARPLDKVGIQCYMSLQIKSPTLRREKIQPPEGFGAVMGEVRAALKADPLHWRKEFLARGGLYLLALHSLDKRLNGK